METICIEDKNGICEADISSAAESLINDEDRKLRRVLLIPPDITRSNSGAGLITKIFFNKLEPECHCDILPALGTHRAMTRDEQINFFGPDIPADRFIVHNWRSDVVSLGTVPAELVCELSDNNMHDPIPVEVNRHLVDGGYDQIISIGQVVPHEVVGMANYTKNILVGCGGSEMINASHMLSIYFGTENLMGIDKSPVRLLFDYVQEVYLKNLPITYVLTVTTTKNNKTEINGLYIGDTRDCFERAVSLSQQLNIVHVMEPIQTCVVYLDPAEFRTTWLGNKAIYRTRKALAPGADLIILAPGFERFGEDLENDRLIRKYGYTGRDHIFSLKEKETELAKNLSVVAHLIQGSSDNKFSITYCTKPEHSEAITSVNYKWKNINTCLKNYEMLIDGYNQTKDGKIFYVSNPALGLWV